MIGNINTFNISNKESLEKAVQEYMIFNSL